MKNLTKHCLGIMFLLVIIVGCKKDKIETPSNNDCVSGKGEVITRTLSVADFKKVDLAIATNIIVKQGSNFEVKAIGQSNIIDLINTSVSNDMWIITTKENTCISDYKLSFEITMPNVDKLLINGSGNITLEDFINQNNLTMEINGSGKITLNKFEGIKKLDLSLGGTGSVIANKDISSITDLNVTISGSGDYNGFLISADNNTVDISGAGDVKLTAVKTLNATITGSGSIHYKGNPTITKNITGSGKIIDAN